MYKRNFISQVILKVDFNKFYNDLKAEDLNQFYTSMKEKENFQNIEYREEAIRNIEIKDDKFDLKDIGRKGIYTIEGGICRFEWDISSFLFITKKYEKFDEFFDTFKKGLEVMKGILEVKEFKRIGLRFTNSIVLEDINSINDWELYIESKFLVNYTKMIPPKFAEFSIRRSMNNVVFGNGEYVIWVNGGLWNKDYPGKIIDKTFILDIDCFVDNRTLDESEILTRPPIMSDFTYDIFNHLTTDKFKQLLNAN